jgi:hypothetical protein
VRAIAIGLNAGASAGAGETPQGEDAIAIGSNAGTSNQGEDAIAIGREAGFTNQLATAIAIGTQAGKAGQGAGAIAIGRQAGGSSGVQSSNAIAIGPNCAPFGQGANAIAIGVNVSTLAPQSANSIMINTTGVNMANIGPETFGIKTVRKLDVAPAAVNILRYNPTTGEITWSAT